MKSLTNDDYTLIDKFINGELSDEETSVFTVRMRDTTFAEELAIYKTTAEGVRHVHTKNLKAELKNLLQEKTVQNDNMRTEAPAYRLYLVAASVIIVMIAAVWLLTTNNNSNHDLFVAYYKPLPATVITRGDNETQRPFAAYAKGDYKTASMQIEQLISTEQDTHQKAILTLLLANCHINLDKPESAENLLRSILSSTDPEVRAHAQWYLALVLLENDRQDETIVLLDQILESQSIYRRQAQSLAERIRTSH